MSPSEDAAASEGCPRLGSTLKTFVINLARRPDRRSHIEELCQSLELNYEFVDAVDGKALAALPGSSFEVLQKRRHKPLAKRRKEVEPLATDASSAAQLSNGCAVQGMRGLKSQMYCARWHDDEGKPQTQLLRMAQHRTQSSSLTQSGHELWGAVGCSQSHQAVLKRLIASPELKWALILEDDACFKQGSEASKVREVFDEAMRFVSEWSPNWGVVYLGGAMSTFTSKDSNAQLGPLQKGLRTAKGVYQTHAFMIRSGVAPEILDLLNKGYAADAAYVCWSRKKCNELRTFLFQPQLLIQPRGTGRWKDSDIFVEGEFFKQEVAKLHDDEYRFDPKRKRGPARIVIARAALPVPPPALALTEDIVMKAPLEESLGKEGQSSPTIMSARVRPARCCWKDFTIFVDDSFVTEDAAEVNRLDDKLNSNGAGKLSQRITAQGASTSLASKEAGVEQPLEESRAIDIQPTILSKKVASIPRPVGLLANISARKAAATSLLTEKSMGREHLSENAMAARPIGLLANISARKAVTTSMMTERSIGRENLSENTMFARPIGLLANISARKAVTTSLLTERSIGKENLSENTMLARPVGLLANISARKAGTAKLLTEKSMDSQHLTENTMPTQPVRLLANISAPKATTTRFLSENSMNPPIKKCRWSAGPSSEFPAKPKSTFAGTIAKTVTPCRASLPAEPSALRDITNTQGSGLGIC